MFADALDLLQIRAEHLDAHRRANARREHVNAIADRHRPGVRLSGDLQPLIELIHQLVPRNLPRPLRLWLQHHRGLHHRQRRRVGRRVRAPCFAEHALHFRHLPQQLILLLQQCTGLGHRNARQRRRHVQDHAFVERRHELGSEAEVDRDGDEHDDHGDDDDGARVAQHPTRRRSVDAEEHAGHGMLLFGTEFSFSRPNEKQHHCRRQSDRQQRCNRHRRVFSERERLEESPFLRFECEDRHEGNCDHQQREKARPANFLNRADEHLFEIALPPVPLPCFEFLVRVLHHNDRSVNERADGHSDAAERHDVGIDAEETHRDEGENHRGGQRDDGNDRARDVPEEDEDHERDDQHLDEQLVFERVNRLFDEL